MTNFCKICGEEEKGDILFHKHHVVPKVSGGKETIFICPDCHFDIHYPDKKDGDLDDLEETYKEAISMNIFSDGHGIIPNKISHNPKLSAFSKIMYCEISSLCASRGYCWARNEYFCKVFKKSMKTVSRAIAELEPYLIIRNRLGASRTIWVHQLGNGLKPFEKKNSRFKDQLIEKAKIKTVYKYSSDDLFLAEMLLSKIIYNFPMFENKKVDIKEWAEEIRKLREIDKAKIEQIKFMITWVHGGEIEIAGKPNIKFEQNDFWSKNIMSARKLRKQWFENLVPQLQEALKKQIKKSTVTQL